MIHIIAIAITIALPPNKIQFTVSSLLINRHQPSAITDVI